MIIALHFQSLIKLGIGNLVLSVYSWVLALNKLPLGMRVRIVVH